MPPTGRSYLQDITYRILVIRIFFKSPKNQIFKIEKLRDLNKYFTEQNQPIKTQEEFQAHVLCSYQNQFSNENHR